MISSSDAGVSTGSTFPVPLAAAPRSLHLNKKKVWTLLGIDGG